MTDTRNISIGDDFYLFSKDGDEKIASRIRCLDRLIQIREDPEIIEHDVNLLATHCAARLLFTLEQRGIVEPNEELLFTLLAFFRYTYLLEHARRYSFATFSKRALEDFVATIISEGAELHLDEKLDAFEYLIFFYVLLQEFGLLGENPRQVRFLKEIQHKIRRERKCERPALGAVAGCSIH